MQRAASYHLLAIIRRLVVRRRSRPMEGAVGTLGSSCKTVVKGACALALLVTTLVALGPGVVSAYGQDIGSSLSEGQAMNPGDYLQYGSYHLVMQSDGNLVQYYGGTALWASGTSGHTGAGVYAVLQGDGNFVLYTGSGSALWASHTFTYPGLVLREQSDGNVVIYSGGTALWSTATAANTRDCWTNDSCNDPDFAAQFLGVAPQAAYPGGVNVWPLTSPNNYAVYTWTRAEGTPLYIANPLATTQPEPGSYNYNYAGVQGYTDNSGQTAWYWGIKATSDTVHNGYYQAIINAVQNPVNGNYQQCVALAQAVGSTPWGTGNFSADC